MDYREREQINNFGDSIVSFYEDAVIPLIDKDRLIHYKPKGKDNSEYGYYINQDFSRLAEILQVYKVKHLVDLGSGSGILLYVLSRYLYYTKFTGYEIEETLINFSNLYLKSRRITTYKKDLLKLTKKDLENFDCLYFWEPIYNKDLAKVFVNRLVTSMYPGQLIIYKCSGSILTHLIDSKAFSKISENGYEIFKKL